MYDKIPKKIHIIGSVGSGKTTLAKQLSSKFDIAYYEIDNIIWKRRKSGDIRRTDEERDEYLNSIIRTEAWIIEGVHNEDWVANSFEQAELIIFLDTKYTIRTYRIIKRFVKQKLKIEPSNYKPTMKIFFKMFKWNRHFEEVGKPNFYNKFGKIGDKLVVVKNKESLVNYFNIRGVQLRK